MKILHTSDWHLGKKLFRLDRVEEHKLFLNWLIEEIIQEEVDLLIISGDLFDSANPSHEAQDLYYDFLFNFSSRTNAHAYIISGNHDSGTLIEAPKSLLKYHRVHVCGKLSQNPVSHWSEFKIKDEKIDILMLPFFRSWELLTNQEDDPIKCLERYLRNESQNPKVLIMHHLAGLCEAAGSEHVISLSGLETIPTSILSEFNYVALGHIHKPQRVAQNAYYAGSPLPMRFSEKSGKSIVTIEINKQHTEIKTREIPIFRELFHLKLTENNWRDELQQLKSTKTLNGVAEVDIHLDTPRAGLVDEIREVLMSKKIELLSFNPTFGSEISEEKFNAKVFDLNTSELFEEFYLTKFPEEKEVPQDLKEEFNNLLERSKHENS